MPNNRRRLQRRKMRNVKFDEERQQRFLAHFAWSCDTVAAAAAAGIREQTVQLHRRNNPAFAAEFDEALEQGYVTLEAEALRQRLAAQRKLRAAIEGAGRGDAALMPEDVGAEFERVMKLLARWDRKRQRPSRLSPEGGGRACTFDAAIALLDARLKALGIEVEPLSPEDAERYDGPGQSKGGGGAAL